MILKKYVNYIMSVIFFGCWGDFRFRVMNVLEKLRRYILDHPEITNVIVAGDNYYIEKTDDKKKIYVPKEASTMIEQLYLTTKGIHTDVLAGNHEYDRIEYDKIAPGPNKLDLSREDECFILHEENNTFEGIQNEQFNFSTIYSPENKSFLLLNGVLYLYLDSSMYEYRQPQCYTTPYDQRDTSTEEHQSRLPPPPMPESEILPALKRKQIEKMLTILDMNRGYKKLVCCAHHPLYIFRVKDGVYKDPVPNYELLDALMSFLPEDTIEIDYMCADFHVYQESLLTVVRGGKTLTINQYIVGTGGTELDEFPDKIVPEHLQAAITDYYTTNLKLPPSMFDVSVNDSTVTIIANGFSVSATHKRSQRDYGFAVIEPGKNPSFILAFDADPVRQEKKKDKKDKKDKKSEGGTKRRRTKRRRSKRTRKS